MRLSPRLAMTTTSIQTVSGATFRDSYVQAGSRTDTLLRNDVRFFVVRVEEMSRLMRLPVPPTRLTNHTLMYLTSGEAVMSVGSETHKIGPNEGLIVPAGQAFSFDTVDLNHGFICGFHPDFTVGTFGGADLLNGFDFLRVWANPRVCFDAQTAGFVTHLFDRLLLDYAEHGLTNGDLLRAYLIALLCEVNRVYRPPSAGPPTHAVVLTNRFRELLFVQRQTHHLVSDYARLLNITPNHLNKCVRSVTGKSPTKWIDEAIVLEAKVLLHQTSLTINEIAAEVGLSDASYFGRLFKKYEGLTPVAFRRRLQTP